jgi:hypothetical protein
LQRTFGLTIHRRSLERLLSGKKNFRTAKSGRLFWRRGRLREAA